MSPAPATVLTRPWTKACQTVAPRHSASSIIHDAPSRHLLARELVAIQVLTRPGVGGLLRLIQYRERSRLEQAHRFVSPHAPHWTGGIHCS